MEEDNEDGVKATAEMRCEGSPNLYRWEMGDVMIEHFQRKTRNILKYLKL